MPHENPVAPTTSPSSFSGGFSRLLALLLCCSLIALGQQAASLQIRPLDVKQLRQSLQAQTKSIIIVVVEEASGEPVPQAAVSFRLPEDGPSGRFANGLRSEIAITGSDGRAAMPPVQWSGEAGVVALRVMAAKGQVRAGVLLNIELTQGAPPAAVQLGVPVHPKPVPKPIVLGASITPPKPEAQPVPVDLQTPRYDPPAFWKSKWFVVALAGGGAVAAGYWAAKSRRTGSAVVPGEFVPGSITQQPVVIGPPLISVGKP
jgi:hypothetical protein